MWDIGHLHADGNIPVDFAIIYFEKPILGIKEIPIIANPKDIPLGEHKIKTYLKLRLQDPVECMIVATHNPINKKV